MNPMSLPLPPASPNLPQLHAALGLKEDPGAELGVGRRVRLLTQDGVELVPVGGSRQGRPVPWR
jgi:hypothetical protein